MHTNDAAAGGLWLWHADAPLTQHVVANESIMFDRGNVAAVDTPDEFVVVPCMAVWQVEFVQDMIGMLDAGTE